MAAHWMLLEISSSKRRVYLELSSSKRRVYLEIFSSKRHVHVYSYKMPTNFSRLNLRVAQHVSMVVGKESCAWSLVPQTPLSFRRHPLCNLAIPCTAPVPSPRPPVPLASSPRTRRLVPARLEARAYAAAAFANDGVPCLLVCGHSITPSIVATMVPSGPTPGPGSLVEHVYGRCHLSYTAFCSDSGVLATCTTLVNIRG